MAILLGVERGWSRDSPAACCRVRCACRGRKSYIYTPGAGAGTCAAGQRQLIRLYRRHWTSRQESTRGAATETLWPRKPHEGHADLSAAAASTVRPGGG